MRVRYCDFCGKGQRDTETGGSNLWEGWCVLSGKYGTGLNAPDICPDCVGKMGSKRELHIESLKEKT